MSLLDTHQPLPSKSYAPLADEVNPTFGNIAPAATVTRNGTVVYTRKDTERTHSSGSNETMSAKAKGKAREMDYEDGGDLGEVKKWKGKGREQDWDVERGEEEHIAEYPPAREEVQEERRIQLNLARIAERDMARRRAARLSKAGNLPTSASATTSFARRPLSGISTTLSSRSVPENKRGSFMGLVGTMWGKKENDWDGQLPLGSPTPGYNNPYDPQPAISPTPRMSRSPEPSPFADPPPPRGSASPLQSPVEEGFTYGYAGPAWRGGAVEGPARADKWWHALCAWGEDLDQEVDEGGTRRQVGRTNPFE